MALAFFNANTLKNGKIVQQFTCMRLVMLGEYMTAGWYNITNFAEALDHAWFLVTACTYWYIILAFLKKTYIIYGHD